MICKYCSGKIIIKDLGRVSYLCGYAVSGWLYFKCVLCGLATNTQIQDMLFRSVPYAGIKAEDHVPIDYEGFIDKFVKGELQ